MSKSIEEMEIMLNIQTESKSRKNMTDEELQEHIRLVYKRNNRKYYLRKKLPALEQAEQEEEEEETEEESEESEEEQEEPEEEEEETARPINNYFKR